jgi:hypothetical protein
LRGGQREHLRVGRRCLSQFNSLDHHPSDGSKMP